MKIKQYLLLYFVLFIAVLSASSRYHTILPDPVIMLTCDGECITIGEENPLGTNCYAWAPLYAFDDPNLPSQEVCAEVTTSYTLTVINEDGDVIESQEYLVEVRNLDVSIYPEEAVLCPGAYLDLEALVWNDNEYLNYQWSNGAQTPNIRIDEAGTYTVTVTDSELACEDQATITVTAQEDFTVTIETNSQDLCTGTTLNLEAVPSNTNQGYQYEWSNGESTSEIIIMEAGLYSVTILDINSDCEAEAELIISNTDIEVEISPKTPLLCNNGEASLSVPDNYTNYVWSTGEEGATLNTITVDELGEYSVTVTDANGCTASNQVKVKDASDPNSIREFFENKGFYSIPIVVDGPALTSPNNSENKLLSSNTFCEGNSCGGTATSCVHDDAQLAILIDEIPVNDLAGMIEENLDYFNTEFSYDDNKAFITANDNLCACTDYLDLVETAFDDSDLGYWIHIFQSDMPDGDRLFILSNVPSEDMHYPGTDQRENFLSSTLNIVHEDPELGNFSSKAEQTVFVLQDLLLDNHVGLSVFQNDGSTPPTSVCENATIYDANIVNPAGIPMSLPAEAILQFGLTPQWTGQLPEGSLSGFTALYNNGNNPKYYKARPDKTGVYFHGYYQVNIRGDYLNESPYPSPVISSFPSTYVILGNRELDDNEVAYYRLEKTEYLCDLPTVQTIGEGVIVPAFNDCLGTVIDEQEYDIDLPPITDANFDSQLDNAVYDWNGGVLLKVLSEDGTQIYIYGEPNLDLPGPPHPFIYYQWNCYTGEWQPFDMDEEGNPQLEDQVNFAYTLGENNASGCEEGGVPGNGEGEELLNNAACFKLSPEEIGPFHFNASNASPDHPTIKDHIGLDHTERTEIDSAISIAASRWGMDMKVILSGDAAVNGDVPNDPDDSAYEAFFGQNMNDTDILYWVHYRNDGSADFCVRFGEDFFDHDVAGVEAIPLAEKLEAKAVLIDAIKKAKGATVESLRDNNPITDIDDDPFTPSSNQPYHFGLRDGHETEVNFFNVTKEVFGIGKVTIKELKIPELVWKQGQNCMFDAAGIVIGPGNAVIEANPLVGLGQGLSLGVSVVSDKPTRDGLIDAVLSPVKMVRGIAKAKYEAYSNTDTEIMHYEAGFDCTNIILAIVSSGGLTLIDDFIAGLGPNAKKGAEKLKKEVNETPENFNDDFFKEFDNIAEDIPEEFLELFKDLGPHYAKMTKNPQLVKAWKQFNGSPDIDFKKVTKKFPKDHPAFYSAFNDVFLAPDGTLLNKTEDFLKDLSSSGDELMGAFTGAPGRVRAWKVLHDAGTDLRLNPDALAKVSFLKSKNLTDAQLTNIGQLNDIKAINVADNLAKRTAPPLPQSVLDELDIIAEKAKAIEIHESNIMNKLEELTSNANYKNPTDLKSNLEHGLASMNSPEPSRGFVTELNEAIRDLTDGETIALGKKNIYGNELDVVSESGQWLKECKRMSSSNPNKFSDQLKNIGKKFNTDSKLNLGERDFYKNNGGLRGIIEIENPSNPLFSESFGQVQNRVQQYINNTTDQIKIGLQSSKSITVIRGTERLHFVKGIHYN